MGESEISTRPDGIGLTDPPTKGCLRPQSLADRLEPTLLKVTSMLQLTPNGLHIGRLPAETASIDVLFDGRRIWSIDVRDRDRANELSVEWPAALLPHLSGSTKLSVVDSGSGDEFDSRELRFDDTNERTAVVNEDGTSLVVNKWGWLGVALEAMSDELQGLIVERSRRLIDELTSAGFRPFVVGGTLLGGVRDGRLLPHDDDADIAYLSEHTNPADVAREAFEVGHLLARLGYEIRRHSATHMQLLFHDEQGSILHYIDVFTAFFTADGHMNQPFHVRGSMQQSDMLPFSQTELAGVAFPAPANTDRWLTINYDANWRTPIPGFQLVTPLETRRRFDNWFGGYNFQREFWDDWFDADQHGDDATQWEPGRGWLVNQLSGMSADTLVDLGSGNGDGTRAAALRRPGVRTIGLDYSDVALERTRAIPQADVSFAHLNLARLQSLSFARTHGIDGPFDVIANHLFDQLGHRTRAQAWRVLRMALRSGGQARFTFHAEPAPNVSVDDPTGWHLTEAQVEAEARAYGLDVSFETLAPATALRRPIGAVVRLRTSSSPGGDHISPSKEHIMTHDTNGLFRRLGSRARRTLGRVAGSGSRVVALQQELRVERERISQLEAEIDELRQNSLRVAELIDLAEQTLTPPTEPSAQSDGDR